MKGPSLPAMVLLKTTKLTAKGPATAGYICVANAPLSYVDSLCSWQHPHPQLEGRVDEGLLALGQSGVTCPMSGSLPTQPWNAPRSKGPGSCWEGTGLF